MLHLWGKRILHFLKNRVVIWLSKFISAVARKKVLLDPSSLLTAGCRVVKPIIVWSIRYINEIHFHDRMTPSIFQEEETSISENIYSHMIMKMCITHGAWKLSLINVPTKAVHCEVVHYLGSRQFAWSMAPISLSAIIITTFIANRSFGWL